MGNSYKGWNEHMMKVTATVIEGPHKVALDDKEFTIIRYNTGTKTPARFPFLRTINQIGLPQFTDDIKEAYIFKDKESAFIIRDLLCSANLGWLRQFDFQIWINEQS